ncbi:unnamed protein product [Camellia sinensis]
MYNMEGEKRKELNMDCLVNVLGRVGIESLLIDVPFVCKSWYKATRSPLCWRKLDFLEISLDDCTSLFFLARLIDDYQVKGKFSFTAIVKTLINEFFMPNVEQKVQRKKVCLNLIVLELPADIDHDVVSRVPKLMSNWKYLEFLRFGTTFKMEETLAQISIHCKNFADLSAFHADIKKNEATSIVTSAPNIEYLGLRYSNIDRESLLMILKGCKKLVYFDVRNCKGFDFGDVEILKLASHIKTFEDEGLHLATSHG